MRRSFYALCATFLLFSVPNLNAQTSQTKAEKKALQHSHIDGNKIAFFSHDDWEKCGQVAHTEYLRQQDPNLSLIHI